jgi:uncharacterized protein (UPF0333 family)
MISNKNAQVAMEYMMVIGYSFFVITVIMGIYLIKSQDQQQAIKGIQIGHISDSIINAAEEVYYLGTPAQKTVRIQVPEGISTINGTEYNPTLGTAALLFYEKSKGITYLFHEGVSTVNISVNISNSPGKKDIRVYSMGDYVCIIDKSLGPSVGCNP